VKFAGTSAGSSTISEGSIVERFCCVTGAWDAHPAIPAQMMMKTDISTIIGARDNFFMNIHTSGE
jgi:hypothetical protein